MQLPWLVLYRWEAIVAMSIADFLLAIVFSVLPFSALPGGNLLMKNTILATNMILWSSKDSVILPGIGSDTPPNFATPAEKTGTA